MICVRDLSIIYLIITYYFITTDCTPPSHELREKLLRLLLDPQYDDDVNEVTTRRDMLLRETKSKVPVRNNRRRLDLLDLFETTTKAKEMTTPTTNFMKNQPFNEGLLKGMLSLMNNIMTR
uniref:Uncharacterized protein n=1 Tax=Glossina brevipalpis TaxID=37001 RepID=A0A1A9W383_9MUSC